MRNCAILLILIALTGCASTQGAIGTVTAAAVFGGRINTNPDPVEYVKEGVNREGRIIYGDVKRKTKQSIANMILILLQPTK